LAVESHLGLKMEDVQKRL